MKRNLLLFGLLLSFMYGVTQEHIKEAGISLELPNNKWKLHEKADQNGLQIYTFKREEIPDSLGRNVIANISVVIESIDDHLDVITYSALKRSQVGFNVIKVFSHIDGTIELENAIGYKGTYSDKYGEHSIYIVHAINKGKGVQIIFDVVTELINDLETEFNTTLKSIKIIH